jgi:hypothetical protein
MAPIHVSPGGGRGGLPMNTALVRADEGWLPI